MKKIVKALLLGLNLLALTALSLSSHASETGSYQLDLPAQSCAESLTRLSEIADVMLLFPAKIAENIRANPVKGRYTLVEALDIMLDGTGLVGSFSDKNVLMISVDESKAVNKEKAMNTKKSLLSAIVGVLVGSGHHVAAQDTEEGSSYDSRVLEEVVVTARKRAESAMSIPESISAFSSSRLERNGIDGLTDVGNLVPNMFMSVRADGFPNVSIRGLGAFGNTQGVGFYVDDVQVFSGISSRVGDIDRIEVLKGPQGILYGGSNIGGAVKFVSKRPVPEEIHGRAKTKIGTDDYYDAEFALNGGCK